MTHPNFDLKRLLDDIDVKPSELAEALGRPRTSVYRWLSEQRVSGDVILQLMQYLDEHHSTVDIASYRLTFGS